MVTRYTVLLASIITTAHSIGMEQSTLQPSLVQETQQTKPITSPISQQPATQPSTSETAQKRLGILVQSVSWGPKLIPMPGNYLD